MLNLDEFESIRLANHEKLYQEEAAARMSSTRPLADFSKARIGK